jgi:hypothetical protein
MHAQLVCIVGLALVCPLPAMAGDATEDCFNDAYSEQMELTSASMDADVVSNLEIAQVLAQIEQLSASSTLLVEADAGNVRPLLTV